LGEEFARHEAARVQADPAPRQRPHAAHRDQVGGTGAGADEVHGHASVSPCSDDADLTTDHWVTGMACRQPVNPPTGTARDTAMRVSSPPWRRYHVVSSASDSRVTVLATS